MEKRLQILAYLMIAPTTFWLLLFFGFPIFETFRTSLYKTSFLGERFVGLGNYANLFEDELFHLVLGNTISFWAWQSRSCSAAQPSSANSRARL
jgi:ABC-type sugar transport system permease subunit